MFVRNSPKQHILPSLGSSLRYIYIYLYYRPCKRCPSVDGYVRDSQPTGNEKPDYVFQSMRDSDFLDRGQVLTRKITEPWVPSDKIKQHLESFTVTIITCLAVRGISMQKIIMKMFRLSWSQSCTFFYHELSSDIQQV